MCTFICSISLIFTCSIVYGFRHCFAFQALEKFFFDLPQMTETPHFLTAPTKTELNVVLQTVQLKCKLQQVIYKSNVQCSTESGAGWCNFGGSIYAVELKLCIFHYSMLIFFTLEFGKVNLLLSAIKILRTRQNIVQSEYSHTFKL